MSHTNYPSIVASFGWKQEWVPQCWLATLDGTETVTVIAMKEPYGVEAWCTYMVINSRGEDEIIDNMFRLKRIRP